MSNSASNHVKAQATGIHPIVFEIAIGAVLWFLAVTWIAFAGKGGIDLDLAVVTLFCTMFVSLFLLVASLNERDSRWPAKHTNLCTFLDSDVQIGSGTMRGRNVLIEIAMIPVTLAFAATLIGLVWMILG